MMIMVLLIGTMFLLGLAWDTYRHRDQPPGHTQSSNPVLGRMLRGIETDTSSPEATAAEAKEAELSGLLLQGSLSPAEYQLEMTRLAQPDSNQAAGPR